MPVAVLTGFLVLLLGCVENVPAQALTPAPTAPQSELDASLQDMARAPSELNLGGLNLGAAISNAEFRFTGDGLARPMSVREVAEVLADADAAAPPGNMEVTLHPGTLGNQGFDAGWVNALVDSHKAGGGASFTNQYALLIQTGNAQIKKHGPATRTIDLADAPPLVNAKFKLEQTSAFPVTVVVPRADLLAIHASDAKSVLSGLVSVVAGTIISAVVTGFCLGFAPTASVACPFIGSVFGSFIGGVLGQAISGSLSDPNAWAVTLGSTLLGAAGGAVLAKKFVKTYAVAYFKNLGGWVRNNLAAQAWIRWLGLRPAVQHGADFMLDELPSDLEMYLATHG